MNQFLIHTLYVANVSSFGSGTLTSLLCLHYHIAHSETEDEHTEAKIYMFYFLAMEHNLLWYKCLLNKEMSGLMIKRK